MTVEQLIEELAKVDPNSQVWLVVDGFTALAELVHAIGDIVQIGDDTL
jgi:hypothetical protein